MAPTIPDSPLIPAGPSGPIAPGCPSLPLSPGSPGSPFLLAAANAKGCKKTKTSRRNDYIKEYLHVVKWLFYSIVRIIIRINNPPGTER